MKFQTITDVRTWLENSGFYPAIDTDKAEDIVEAIYRAYDDSSALDKMDIEEFENRFGLW